MNKVAIAFLTCDDVELTKQSLPMLMQPDKFDLHWIDGSKTPEGINLPTLMGVDCDLRCQLHPAVYGKADTAVAYALSTLLKSVQEYDYIGLVENDIVFRDMSWFQQTMQLFAEGWAEGLHVGAVSARCFEDRVLIQRPRYAVMHNLGYGTQIMTREAAQIALHYFRTGHTNENRRVFQQISGIDIASFWCFRAGQHVLVSDWNFDLKLAARGLASLALTPSPVSMIGPDNDLAKQGLVIAQGPVEARVDDLAFAMYRDNLQRLHEGTWQLRGQPNQFAPDMQNGCFFIFPHMCAGMGMERQGDWRLLRTQGFGPFSFVAGGDGGTGGVGATLEIPVVGSCYILCSGGKRGGRMEVLDTYSKYRCSPDLPPESLTGQMIQLDMPNVGHLRTLRITAEPGVIFYGIAVKEEQTWFPRWRFDHAQLPPV